MDLTMGRGRGRTTLEQDWVKTNKPDADSFIKSLESQYEIRVAIPAAPKGKDVSILEYTGTAVLKDGTKTEFTLLVKGLYEMISRTGRRIGSTDVEMIRLYCSLGDALEIDFVTNYKKLGVWISKNVAVKGTSFESRRYGRRRQRRFEATQSTSRKFVRLLYDLSKSYDALLDHCLNSGEGVDKSLGAVRKVGEAIEDLEDSIEYIL